VAEEVMMVRLLTICVSVVLLAGFAGNIQAETILHWSFEGSVGANIISDTDSAGGITVYGFTDSGGAGGGSLTYSDGIIGTAASFFNPHSDNSLGVALFANDQDVLDLKNLPQFTLEGFINVRTDRQSVCLARKYGGDGRYYVDIRGNGTLNFVISNDNTDNNIISSAPGTIQTGTWYHVAAVFDETDAAAPMKLYLDGALVAQGGLATRVADSTRGFGMGCIVRDNLNPPANTGQFFDGLIDELRISNVALEPGEFLSRPPRIGFETSASGNLEEISPAQLVVTLAYPEDGQTYGADYMVTGGTATGCGVDYYSTFTGCNHADLQEFADNWLWTGDGFNRADFTRSGKVDFRDFSVFAGQWLVDKGTMLFMPGETSKTIELNIINDGLDEDNETIEVTLSNISGAELGVDKHTYTIMDPRPQISFVEAEGHGNENVTTVNIPVTLTNPTDHTVSVNYGVTGGTATPGTDYTLMPGTLSFTPGITNQLITMNVVDDELEESSETVVVTLSDPTDAILDIYTYTYTIYDNDSAYYVDSGSGDDSNDGRSPSTAFKTLSKLNSITYVPGDRILFKSGTVYVGSFKPSGSGAEGSSIIVDIYGGTVKPRIDGQGAYAALELNNVEYWEVNNLELTNNRPSTGKYKGAAIKINNFGVAHHIHLKNLYIHNVNGYYNIKNYTMGILVNSSGTADTYFDDLLIENCHIRRTDRDGIIIKTDEGQEYMNKNVVVRGNVIEDVAGDAMVIWDCDGAVVEYNYVNGFRQRVDDLACGIWPYRSNNTIIQYNEVCNGKGTGDGQGFDSDRHCHGTIFQYNYSHDNDGGFMLIMGDDNSNNIIRYNISQNDGGMTFFFPGGSYNNYIYNNTMYIPSGVYMPLVYMNNYMGSYPHDTYFYNNIFYVDGSVSYTLGSGSNIVFNSNIYYGSHSGRPTDSSGITANPMLFAPGTGGTGRDTVNGYKLQPGSPAINTGRLVGGNGGQDFWGNTVPNGVTDRGAHEAP
jgi:hypothetical protein